MIGLDVITEENQANIPTIVWIVHVTLTFSLQPH